MTDRKWLFWVFCAGPRLVSVSPFMDVLNMHSQRTVQYSDIKNRPVQTSEILDSFKEIIQ